MSIEDVSIPPEAKKSLGYVHWKLDSHGLTLGTSLMPASFVESFHHRLEVWVPFPVHAILAVLIGAKTRRQLDDGNL
jgi:hypothetical protein